MDQNKNIQAFRVPNLVPWDWRGRHWFVILLILSSPRSLNLFKLIPRFKRDIYTENKKFKYNLHLYHVKLN